MRQRSAPSIPSFRNRPCRRWSCRSVSTHDPTWPLSQRAETCLGSIRLFKLPRWRVIWAAYRSMVVEALGASEAKSAPQRHSTRRCWSSNSRGRRSLSSLEGWNWKKRMSIVTVSSPLTEEAQDHKYWRDQSWDVSVQSQKRMPSIESFPLRTCINIRIRPFPIASKNRRQSQTNQTVALTNRRQEPIIGPEPQTNFTRSTFWGRIGGRHAKPKRFPRLRMSRSTSNGQSRSWHRRLQHKSTRLTPRLLGAMAFQRAPQA